MLHYRIPTALTEKASPSTQIQIGLTVQVVTGINTWESRTTLYSYKLKYVGGAKTSEHRPARWSTE